MHLSPTLLKLKWILVRLCNVVMAIVRDMAGIHRHPSMVGIHLFFQECLTIFFNNTFPHIEYGLHTVPWFLEAVNRVKDFHFS